MKLRARSKEAERLDDRREDSDARDDAAVRERLRRLAAAERDVAAPVHVEWQVMRAWDQAHPPAIATTRTRLRWMALPAAAAVGLACAVTLVTLARFAQPVPRVDRLPPSVPPRAANTLAGMHSDALDTHDAPALSERREPERVEGPAQRARARRVAPLPAAAPQTVNVLLVGTPVSPGEQMRVVRVRIARTTLTAMGLRAVGSGDAETVDVDMLVGEDGVARGLRVGM